MRPALYLTTALCALSAVPALAQTATPVDELVITAARLPTPVDRVTGARVVTRDEIAARQSPFVVDILSSVPGVAVARAGGFGGLAAVRIRGAGPDKTLFLMDGTPLNDPSDPTGVYDVGSLPLDDVDRIEVLSGPQGSLWGSEAIGGVVSVVSRPVDGWRASAEAGSFGTARGSAAAGIVRDAWRLSAQVAALKSDGVSKADVRDGAREDDGIETTAITLSGAVKPAEGVALDAVIKRNRSIVDVDGFAPPAFLLGDTPDRAKSEAWTGVLRARIDGPFAVLHTLSLSAYDLDRRSLSSFPSHYTAERQVWRWTAEHGDADAPLAWTAGLERDRTEADLDGRTNRSLGANSAFVVGRARPVEPLTVTASLRYDDPEGFKARGTGRLSAAWDVGAGITLTASAGQGFKTPTLSQIVCDFCFPAGPAVGLKPERADGYDLRAGWRSADGRFDAALTGFKLSVRDQIAYVAGRYVNIERTRSTGVEAEARAVLAEGLRLDLAYAVIDATDARTSASLLRVPDHSGSATLVWARGPASGSVTVRGETSQADTARDGFSRTTREGFVTADAAAAWALNRQVSLTARIDNLADEAFQETFGYGEPGRAVYLGMKLTR